MRRWWLRWRYSKAVDRQTDETDLPALSEDGVDLTLIRWMLSLTPAERLQALQGAVQSISELRALNGNK